MLTTLMMLSALFTSSAQRADGFRIGMEQARAQDVPLLVYVHGSDWNMLGQELLEKMWLASSTDRMLEDHHCILVDVDVLQEPTEEQARTNQQRNKGWKKQGLRTYPAIIALSPDGTVLGTRQGFSLPRDPAMASAALLELIESIDRKRELEQIIAEAARTGETGVEVSAWHELLGLPIDRPEGALERLEQIDPEDASGVRTRMSLPGFHELIEEATKEAIDGRPEQARDRLLELLRNDAFDDQSRAWINVALGSVYRRWDGHHDECIDAFKTAWGLDPGGRAGTAGMRWYLHLAGKDKTTKGLERAIVANQVRGGAYAIPKLLVTSKGTALVLVQDRRGGDWGSPIDPVLYRSEDGGKTWSRPVMLPTDEESPRRHHVKSTAIVEDRETSTLFAFIAQSPLRNDEGRVLSEWDFYRNIQDTRRLGRGWSIIRSTDDGRTWSEPTWINDQLVVEPHWQEWSPVDVGIQLQEGPNAGRLVVPVRCYCPDSDPSELSLANQYNAVIYSDDGGETWIPGGRGRPHHGESVIVELPGGAIYSNERRSEGTGRLRSGSISRDGGVSFTEHMEHEDLPDQLCHAGITRGADGMIYLSNVPGPDRTGLTLSRSRDQGATWERVLELEPTTSAYSSLGLLPDGTLLCVYETGTGDRSREHVVSIRIPAGLLK